MVARVAAMWLTWLLVLAGLISAPAAATTLAPGIVDPAGDNLDPTADVRRAWISQPNETTLHFSIATAAPLDQRGQSACSNSGPWFDFHFVPIRADGSLTIDRLGGERLFVRMECSYLRVLDLEFNPYGVEFQLVRSAPRTETQVDAISGRVDGTRLLAEVDLLHPLLGFESPSDLSGASIGLLVVEAESYMGWDRGTCWPVLFCGGPPPTAQVDRAPDSGFGQPFSLTPNVAATEPQVTRINLTSTVGLEAAEFLVPLDEARAFVPPELGVTPHSTDDASAKMVLHKICGHWVFGGPKGFNLRLLSVAVEPPASMVDARFAAGSYLLPIAAFAGDEYNASILRSWNLPVWVEPTISCWGVNTHLDPAGPEIKGDTFAYDGFRLEYTVRTAGGDWAGEAADDAWRFLITRDHDQWHVMDVEGAPVSGAVGHAFLNWTHPKGGRVDLMTLSGTVWSPFDGRADQASLEYVRLGLEGDGETTPEDAASPLGQEPEGQDPNSHGGPAKAILTGISRNDAWGPITLSALGIMALAALALEAFRLGGLGAALKMPLFSRLDEDRLLRHPRRAALFDFVRANPGASLSDAQRALGKTGGNVAYHARRLRQGGLIRCLATGSRLRLFPGPAPWAPAPYLTRVQQRILEAIKRNPGISQASLARAARMSRENLHYHANRLAHLGLIQCVRDGRLRRHFPHPRPQTPPSS